MAIPLLATLGVSALGQGLSSYMAARANQNAEKMLQNRISSLENTFNIDQNTNFLNTEEGAGILEKLRQQMGEMTKRNERNAIKTNQTNEAQIATQDAASKNYARSLSDLAIYGRQRKDQNAWRYQNLLGTLYDREQGVAAAKAQNWNQLGNNISNLTGTTLEAFGGDWLKDKSNVATGS